MNEERIRKLLLNKDVYYLKYFLNDIQSLLDRITNVKLINVGTTMRMMICFSCKNKYDYFYLKKKLSTENNFLNGTVHSGEYCANFVTDKKNNEVLEMVRCFKQ